MDILESNWEHNCALCGTELGFRRYKARIGSQYRFCTIQHMEEFIKKREEAVRNKETLRVAEKAAQGA